MNLYINIKGQGPALVMFHGWGFDHSIWDTLSQNLQHHFQLYLVDLPGFGHTEIMSWDTFKQLLLQRLPAVFSVSGWSLGGLYAMRLAIEEPSRVLRLLITASSPRFIKTDNWPGVDKIIFDGFYNNLARDQQQTIRDFINLQGRNQPINPQKNYLSSTQGLSQGLQILDEWDLRQSLLHYNNPACFVFGRLDAIIPSATMTKMQQCYPSFEYQLFPKAAHMPFLSHQQAYLEILEAFLL